MKVKVLNPSKPKKAKSKKMTREQKLISDLIDYAMEINNGTIEFNQDDIKAMKNVLNIIKKGV